MAGLELLRNGLPSGNCIRGDAGNSAECKIPVARPHNSCYVVNLFCVFRQLVVVNRLEFSDLGGRSWHSILLLLDLDC